MEKKPTSRFPQNPALKSVSPGVPLQRRPFPPASAGVGAPPSALNQVPQVLGPQAPNLQSQSPIYQGPLGASSTIRPEAQRIEIKAPLSGRAAPQSLLGNGFTADESKLLHEALRLSNMQWFDGEGSILGKTDKMEVSIRPGVSEQQRWAVMAVPIYDMNAPGAVEICLHFMAESFDMAHVLDFQYQIAINLDAERLEFLMQIPIAHMTASQVGEVIRTFTQAMLESLTQELSSLMERMETQKPQ